MSDKTINQHYVPRVYLKRFCSGDLRINVFDKVKKEIRRNQSIDNVGAERYFYDINFRKLLDRMREDQVSNFIKDYPDVNVGQLDEQYIEHLLGNSFESTYDSTIGDIIDRAEKKTIWELKNCYALNHKEKLEIALYASVQILRSKNFREVICDTQRAMGKLMTEIAHQNHDLPDDVEVIFADDRDTIKLQHGDMLLDEENIQMFTSTLINHYWLVLRNMTSLPFCTSDNPIATLPHKGGDFVKHTGIGSVGIEIFYPLSPRIAVVMFEKTFHTDISLYDRRYVTISDPSIIEEYNICELRCSVRNIFTSGDDLSFCVDACVKDPTITGRNKLEMLFGGKRIY